MQINAVEREDGAEALTRAAEADLLIGQISGERVDRRGRLGDCGLVSAPEAGFWAIVLNWSLSCTAMSPAKPPAASTAYHSATRK